MDKILYGSRCRCRENVSITKKTFQSEGKPLQYPKRDEPKNIVELNDKINMFTMQLMTFYMDSNQI